eukprot:970992_1
MSGHGGVKQKRKSKRTIHTGYRPGQLINWKGTWDDTPFDTTWCCECSDGPPSDQGGDCDLVECSICKSWGHFDCYGYSNTAEALADTHHRCVQCENPHPHKKARHTESVPSKPEQRIMILSRSKMKEFDDKTFERIAASINIFFEETICENESDPITIHRLIEENNPDDIHGHDEAVSIVTDKHGQQYKLCRQSKLIAKHFNEQLSIYQVTAKRDIERYTIIGFEENPKPLPADHTHYDIDAPNIKLVCATIDSVAFAFAVTIANINKNELLYAECQEMLWSVIGSSTASTEEMIGSSSFKPNYDDSISIASTEDMIGSSTESIFEPNFDDISIASTEDMIGSSTDSSFKSNYDNISIAGSSTEPICDNILSLASTASTAEFECSADYLFPSEYTLRDTSGNGCCLFNAIECCNVYLNNGRVIQMGSVDEFNNAAELRKECCEFIRENKFGFVNCDDDEDVITWEDFIEQETGMSFDDYVDAMSESRISDESQLGNRRNWAGNMEIIAISEMQRRCIYVYQMGEFDGRNMYKKLSGNHVVNSTRPPINICWTGDHYGYLIKKNENENQNDMDDMDAMDDIDHDEDRHNIANRKQGIHEDLLPHVYD